MAYCDGKNDLVDICKIIKIGFEEAYEYFTILKREGLIEEI
jgi:aminopeptidase-like protein